MVDGSAGGWPGPPEGGPLDAQKEVALLSFWGHGPFEEPWWKVGTLEIGPQLPGCGWKSLGWEPRQASARSGCRVRACPPAWPKGLLWERRLYSPLRAAPWRLRALVRVCPGLPALCTLRDFRLRSDGCPRPDCRTFLALGFHWDHCWQGEAGSVRCIDERLTRMW